MHAPWYVFGAQAVLVWGRPRLTADVDVTLRLDPEEPDRLIEALAKENFIVLAGPGLEEQFLARAVMVDIGIARVPFISPEDLVVTKILAGRPKDIEDIRGILAERAATLNAATIRDTLRLLEDALSVNDLIPTFDAEWRRVPSTRA